MSLSWYNLGRALSSFYTECLEDTRAEKTLLQSITAIEARAAVLYRTKISLAAWLAFLNSGRLERTERLEAPPENLIPDSAGNPSVVRRFADAEIYLEFVSELASNPELMCLLSAHNANVDPPKTLHYAMADTVAYFLFGTAVNPIVGTKLFCKVFDAVLEREFELEEDVRMYLAKGDPRDDTTFVPFGRCILSRVIQELLSTHVFLEPISMLLEHVALDEEVNFAQEREQSGLLSFLDQLSAAVLSAMKSAILIPVMQILAMFVSRVEKKWGENSQDGDGRLNAVLSVWYLFFRDQLLVFLVNPITSGTFRKDFISPNCQSNFSILTRLFESFDSPNPTAAHIRLKTICENVTELVMSIYLPKYLNGNFGIDKSNVYDACVCLHTREIRGMHLFFSTAFRACNSSSVYDPKQTMAKFAKLSGLETKNHNFLMIPLSSTTKISSVGEAGLLDGKVIQASICKIVETGKATADLLDEKVMDDLICSALPLFVSCLTQIFNELDDLVQMQFESADISRKKQPDIISLLILARDSISTRIRSTCTRRLAKLGLLCTQIEALRITLDSMSAEQLTSLYYISESWLSEAIEKHQAIAKHRRFALANMVRKYEDRCEIIEEDCDWIKKRLFIVKVNDILNMSRFRFQHNISLLLKLPPNAKKGTAPKTHVHSLEASNFQEFWNRYQAFIFGEGVQIAEDSEPGSGLKIASDVLLKFSDRLLASVREDPELQEMIQGEIEISLTQDLIEEFLCRKLFSALNFVIISVQVPGNILQDQSKAVDFVHDEVFLDRLRKLSWIQPQHLDFRIGKHRLELLGDEMLYRRAAHELRRLDTWHCKTPKEKLECLTRSIKIMTQGLCFELQSRFPDADSSFPALILMIIRVAPRNLPSNLQFISHFRNPAKLDLSEHAYCFSQFSLAQSFIMNMGPKVLTISQEEWDARMT